MTKKRLLFTALFLLGPLIVLGGFFYDVVFAGIPYQDPTPELQSRYLLHSTIASYLRYCGLVCFAASIIVWVGYKFVSKRSWRL